MSNANPRPNPPGPKLALSSVFGRVARITKRDRRPSALLSPQRSPPKPPFLAMGKLKKPKASPAASVTPVPQDEAVLDDLFAQLDAQHETNKPPLSAKAPAGDAPSTSSSDKKMTANGAMSSAKARFKAREVGAIPVPPRCSYSCHWQPQSVRILTHSGFLPVGA